MDERYNNYHKHTHYSNIFSPDTHVKTEDYCKRAIELGHDRVFTTEHGYGGDVFNAKDVCDSYGLKCIFGVEGYIVVNPAEKDNRNYHIFIAPKTNTGRRQLNKIISKANKTGYYYKPRFNPGDLLGLDRNGFILTTACMAGIVRDSESTYKIFKPLLEHFGSNMFLEVQPHIHEKQIEHNKRVILLAERYDCQIISANDSHYIYPEDATIRKDFLTGKNINYGDEDSFVLDYPDISTIKKRYSEQGVLSEEQVEIAVRNTLVFDECEEVGITKVPKMPTLYPEKTSYEKYQILEDLAYEKFQEVVIEDGIDSKDVSKYLEKLNDCLKVVKDTEELNTEDYFLIDQKIVERAINVYGGVLTRTGRGSGGAFYLNRVLGLTQLDSYTTEIPMYPDRFMSTARILENKSFPDIDLNIVSQEPFVKASKDLLGENGCIPMLTYGTMQISESFRNKCRSMGIPFEEYNSIGKDLEKYHDDPRWGPIIRDAEKLVDVIVSGSVHPCAHVLFNGDLEEEIGCVRLKDNVCCIITSDEADSWKYLKNDYLIVTVWDIIDKVFKEIGRPIMSLSELRNSLDDEVWRVYSNGLTCTVNQVDSDWSTSLAMRYKPRSIDEVAKLTAAIRPSFDPWRETFINRIPYTNHNRYMDELLSSTDHYILFQENIMQYFEWLGVSPSESIGLIKKISKKKIKEEDFKRLEDRIRENWIKKTGAVDGFYENWGLIQSCMSYGFNSPHAIGYGYDSVYGAYLKSHYPVQYYTVALNLYSDDQERTSKLIKEMKYYKVFLKGIKFRNSRSVYSYDIEKREIYKGIEAIKFLNASIAEELYLLRDRKYNNFTELLFDIDSETHAESDQLEILIKLDFFSEFGISKSLLAIYNNFKFFKKGQSKQMAKSKVTNDILRSIIARNSRETEKTYMDLDVPSILSECEEYLVSTIEKDFSPVEKMDFQTEYLGYVDFGTGKPEDRFRLVVTSVESLKTKDKTKVWARRLIVVSLGNGKRNELTVYERYFSKNQVMKGDIIQIVPAALEKKVWNGRENWYLNRYTIDTNPI